MSDLSPGLPPSRVTIEGLYCRLEPLAIQHADALWAAIEGPDLAARYRWLPGFMPDNAAEHRDWVAGAAKHPEWLYWAIIDRQTGLCGGHQALMRIRPENRSVEIGHVLWGCGIARSRIATEALFLTAQYVFETLGYRRFEWKCNNDNLPSKNAARRFGFVFEGIFRQDMIVRGENRDTAWFSMLDCEWPALKPIYKVWLDPANFDEKGTQKTRLGTPR